MANTKDLFYRPDIKKPEKDSDVQGELQSITSPEITEAIAQLTQKALDKDVISKDVGIGSKDFADLYDLADISDGKRSNALDAYKEQFIRYEVIGKELRSRLEFLIDMMLEDIDADVSSAPDIVKQYIKDLTGIDIISDEISLGIVDSGSKTSAGGDISSLTGSSDLANLSADTVKCIFAAAGIKDPLKDAKELSLDDTKEEALDKVQGNLSKIKALDIVKFGLTLLIIVVKICFVVIVHSTIGYICGYFKDKLIFGINKKIMKVRLKFQFKIGKMMAKLFGVVEKKLLAIVGYKCSAKGGKAEPKCDPTGDPKKIQINRVTCCTMKPIFFNESKDKNGKRISLVNECFQSWLNAQLFPDTEGNRGPICGGPCKSKLAGEVSTDKSLDDIDDYSSDSTDDNTAKYTSEYSKLGKDTLETINDDLNTAIDTYRDTLEALKTEYTTRINQPDPPLPVSRNKFGVVINNYQQQAAYKATCDANRAAITATYNAKTTEINNAITDAESRVSFISDLLFDNMSDDDSSDSAVDDETVGDPNCEPSDVERAKAKVVADYLINRPSKSGLTNPGNIAVCSQGIAKADTAVSLSQGIQSSIDSTKQHQYTGNPSGAMDCFGYTDPSDYAKYRGMSDKEREKAMEYDLQQKIAKRAAELEADKTGTDTLVFSDEIFGANGKNDFTDILGMADELTSGLLKTADDVVVKVSGMTRWASSQPLCCVIYIMVFIVSMCRVFAKGSEYTLCRKKCKKCGGLGSIPNSSGGYDKCPECNGSGYGKDIMDSSEWVREFMKVQWAKNAARNSNVQALVALLKIIKEIVDIFIQKSKRQAMLSGLVLPLHDMFELIKLTISTALSQFIDALFGPLEMALTSALAVPEIKNMVNNECPIVAPLIRWLQCMLSGMKYGIITSLMKAFDANVQDVVIINDVLICRQRLFFLESFSKLLGDLLNMILSLKDCYDPGSLVDYIIEDVQNDQYARHVELLNLLKDKERVDKFNACYSDSLMGNTVCYTPQEVEEISSRPGNTLGGFGDELADTIDQFNRDQDLTPLKVTYVTSGPDAGSKTLSPDDSLGDKQTVKGSSFKIGDSSGMSSDTIFKDRVEKIKIPSIGDFKKDIEGITGVNFVAVRESMNDIYKILSGQESAV